jgi:hypothetical protein
MSKKPYQPPTVNRFPPGTIFLPVEGVRASESVPNPRLHGKNLSLGRGALEQEHECHFCRCLTRRIIGGKVEGDTSVWQTVPCCDYCFRILLEVPGEMKEL